MTNWQADLEADQLRRSKEATPEQRMQWLADAQEFVREIRKNAAKNQEIMRRNMRKRQ